MKHVIVSGHYNCGGVNAALQNLSLGLIDNWLRHVQDVYRQYKAEIDVLSVEAARPAVRTERPPAGGERQPDHYRAGRVECRTVALRSPG